MQSLKNFILYFLWILIVSYSNTVALASKEEDSTSISRIVNRKVTVGLSIAQIFKVEGAITQFNASGYIYYHWRDSSLIYIPRDAQDTLRILKEAPHSAPKLEFVNGQEIEYQYEDFMVKPDGTVIRKKKFEGIFRSPMDLRKFPFDRQELTFIVESFIFDMNNCVLMVDPKLITIGKNVYQEEWQFSKPSFVISESKSDPTTNVPISRITFEIKAKRNWHYYFWNVILQLFIFVLISMGVYFIPPADIKTTTGMTLTMLLTVVAFHISLADRIPTLSYRTFMDDFDSLCMFTILYNFVIVIVHKSLLQKGRERTVRKSVAMHRILILPIFLLLLGIIFIYRI